MYRRWFSNLWTKSRLARAEIMQASCSLDSPNSFKSLCHTQWTVRTPTIKTILDKYPAILDTLEDVVIGDGETEAVTKAPGLISLMVKRINV